MEKRICSKCGKEIKKDGLFCPYCGEEYVEECVESNHVEQKICKTCGAELSNDSAFCTYCGTQCGTPMINQWNNAPIIHTKEESNSKNGFIWGMTFLTIIVLVAVAIFTIKSFRGEDSKNSFGENWTERDSFKDEEPTSEIYDDEMAKLLSLKDSKEGDMIEFGTYYDEAEEWVVLKRDGDILTLVSKGMVCNKAYNDYGTEEVTWETCDLRTWLNEEYFNEAFDEMEQQLIEETLVENADNPEYGTEGGNDTWDKFFLLSFEEILEYFPYEETRREYYSGWLRSPGRDHHHALYIDLYGAVTSQGDITSISREVYPVFRLNLSKLDDLE